ncbi:MAG: hypothetical protein QOK05_188 [Chloroflexota bacterium]|jgi:hypothetical protein|nr:hypothetical protein [Chloroflexota bacterium]
MTNRHRVASIAALFTAVATAAWPVATMAATQPRLGTALNFAVLAGQTITNTNPTVINGQLGLFPGSSVTGFPPGVSGVQHITDSTASLAKDDLVTAYTDAANAPTTSDMTGQNLAGKNLTPGVYAFSDAAYLNGPLTLSGKGVYIFKITSALITGSSDGATVLLANGAQACAVYWQVGSSATIGSATHFQGNIMALSSITMVSGATLIGRALARNASLTLDNNTITPPSGSCDTTGGSSTGTTGTTTSTATPSLPSAGGGPPRQPGTPWVPMAILAAVGGIGVGLRLRARHHLAAPVARQAPRT